MSADSERMVALSRMIFASVYLVRVLESGQATAEMIRAMAEVVHAQLVHHVETRMARAMRALVVKRFQEEWWADARRMAQQAQEAGATQFLAICPDGGIRDLLDGDKEWTE